MISFAASVKEEIIRVKREPAQDKAELAAMIQLLSTISITSRGTAIVIRTENPDIARKILGLVKQFYTADTELSMIQKIRLKKNRVYVIRVLDAARTILRDLGLWTKEGLMSHPKAELTRDDEAAKAYLAGCFLAAGSVNNPAKPDYHLEIATGQIGHARYIIRVFRQLGMRAKSIKRREQYVVYLKSADLINDFLAHVGAQEAAFAYADIKIRRDYYNSVTRLENCETANEVKSIRAGEKQAKAIKRLRDAGALEMLEPKLREIGELRLEFPEASLNELAAQYAVRTGAALSKSGIKHRLGKLEELADKGIDH